MVQATYHRFHSILPPHIPARVQNCNGSKTPSRGRQSPGADRPPPRSTAQGPLSIKRTSPTCLLLMRIFQAIVYLRKNGRRKRLRDKCVHTAQVLSDESENRPLNSGTPTTSKRQTSFRWPFFYYRNVSLFVLINKIIKKMLLQFLRLSDSVI